MSEHFVRLWGKIIKVPARPDHAVASMVSARLREVERSGVDSLPVASFADNCVSKAA